MDERGRVSPDLFEDAEEFPAALSDSEDERTEAEVSLGSHVSTGETTAAAATGGENEREPSERLCVSPTAPLSRIGLNDNKAGMEGLDRAAINQVILDATKGSKYYENELRKERLLQKRVRRLLEALENVAPSQRAAALKAADKELEALEDTRDLGHIIVHIDMDAFYASVEMRDNPRLKDVPMAVGGNSMLSTSNYLARRYGVRAAMPGFIARKLCPNLVIVPLHFDKYQDASERVREVLARYDCHFCPVGLDESYLDLTRFVGEKMDQEQQPMERAATRAGSSSDGPSSTLAECRGSLTPRHWRCAEEVVEGLRREIQERTGLTASAGLAPNMMLAKVASDMNKPDGQFTITPTRDAVIEFTRKLPIRKISGIGKVTESMLNALEVTTCGDLHRQRAVLQLLFSPSSSSHFLRVSLGLGSTLIHREHVRKSMGNERTFSELSGASELQGKCRELCEELASDMERDAITGHTVAVKLKTVDFEVKTRAVTLSRAVSSAEQLYSAASELLGAEIRACAPSPLRLRLMGVRVSSLQRRELVAVGRGKQETLDVFVQQSTSTTTTLATTPATIPAIETNAGEVVGEMVRCPVCGMRLEETRIQSINAHIDECLSLPIITSITAGTSGTTSSHQRTAANLTTDNPRKTKKSTSTVASPRKLRGKVNERERGVAGGDRGPRKRGSETENCATKRPKTLDQFWN